MALLLHLLTPSLRIEEQALVTSKTLTSHFTTGHHEVGYLVAKGHPPRPAKPMSDLLPWEYAGNELHPNQKPVVAIVPLIQAFSLAGVSRWIPLLAVARRGCRRYNAGGSSF